MTTVAYNRLRAIQQRSLLQQRLLLVQAVELVADGTTGVRAAIALARRGGATGRSMVEAEALCSAAVEALRVALGER